MSPLTQKVHPPPQSPLQKPREAHSQLRLPMLAPGRQILRVADLVALLNLSRTTIWRMRRTGLLPQLIRLSANAIGWPAHVIDEWLAQRPRRDRMPKPERKHARHAERGRCKIPAPGVGTAIAAVTGGNYSRRCGKPHRHDDDHRPRGFSG